MVPSPSGTKKAHDLLSNQGMVQKIFPQDFVHDSSLAPTEKRFIGSFKRNALGNFGDCGLKSSMGHPKGMTLKTTAENQKLQIWGRQKSIQILQSSILQRPNPLSQPIGEEGIPTTQFKASSLLLFSS